LIGNVEFMKASQKTHVIDLSLDSRELNFPEHKILQCE